MSAGCSAYCSALGSTSCSACYPVSKLLSRACRRALYFCPLPALCLLKLCGHVKAHLQIPACLQPTAKNAETRKTSAISRQKYVCSEVRTCKHVSKYRKRWRDPQSWCGRLQNRRNPNFCSQLSAASSAQAGCAEKIYLSSVTPQTDSWPIAVMVVMRIPLPSANMSLI